MSEDVLQAAISSYPNNKNRKNPIPHKYLLKDFQVTLKLALDQQFKRRTGSIKVEDPP